MTTRPTVPLLAGARAALRAALRRPSRACWALGAALFLTQVAAAEPLTYQEAMRRADVTPVVVAAERALELARKQLAVAASPLRAEVTAGYAYAWGERLPAAGASPVDLTGGNLDPISLVLTLPDLGVGPAADAEARARADVARAETELAATRRAQRTEVATAYARAVRARTALSLALDDADLAAAELGTLRARFGAGAATASDVARGELAVRRTTDAADAATRELDLALAGLTLALGGETVEPADDPPPPILIVRAATTGAPSSSATAESSAISAAELHAPSLATLRALVEGSRAPEASALTPRSDVLAAALAVADTDRTAAATLRENLPSGTLSATYQTGDDTTRWNVGAALDSRTFAPSVSAAFDPDDGVPGVLEGGRSESFTLALGVRIPLDTSLVASIEAGRLARERARAQLDLARARAELDLRRAANEVLGAVEAYALAEDAARLAAGDADVMLRRAEAGTAAELAARRSRLDAERARLDADRAIDGVRTAVLRFLDAAAADPAALE